MRSGARLSWAQRAAALTLVATLAVLAFFFLAVAAVVGAVIAMVLLARLWWVARKGGKPATRGTYEGEYVVIEHSKADPADPPQRPEGRA